MRSALASVDGVENVEIDFAAKTAKVTCESGCSTEELIGALEETNRFGGSVKQ